MSKPNGGPAFPTTEYYDEKPIGSVPGMTLRDYFAGQALTRCQPTDDDSAVFELAQWAYSVADAMLKARAK